MPQKPELSAGLMGQRDPDADFIFRCKVPFRYFAISCCKDQMPLFIKRRVVTSLVVFEFDHSGCKEEFYFQCVTNLI